MLNISYSNFGLDHCTEIVTRGGIRKLCDISMFDNVSIRGEDGNWHDAEIHRIGLVPAYRVKLGKHQFFCSADQSWPIMNARNTLKSVKRTEELSVDDRIRFTVDCMPEYEQNIEAYKCGLLYCDSRVTPNILQSSETELFNWLQAVFSVLGIVDSNGYHALMTSADYNMLSLVRDVCAIVGINTSEVQECTSHSNYYRLTLNKSSLTSNFFTNSYHLRRWDKVRSRPTICQLVKSVTKLDGIHSMCAVVTHGCDMFTLGTGELIGSPSLLLGDRNGSHRQNN